jgi:Fe-S cluster assembly protein SufD
MSNIDQFREQFERLQERSNDNGLGIVRKDAFKAFSKMGIPTTRHEEWKYTRISNLFNANFDILAQPGASLAKEDIDEYRLPGHEGANELVFVNGLFSFALSTIRSSSQLEILPLETAASNEFKEIVHTHFGHSSNYLKDGINALNTAFVSGAVFLHVKERQTVHQPIYIYNITDARSNNVLSQPRSLVHLGEQSQVYIVETFVTLGTAEAFTNQVMEIVLEKDAHLEYYKIQEDRGNQVSTTHIRHIAKSYSNTVTLSLDGAMVRNNLNIVLDAEHCESHLYGLYLQRGDNHVDNHTAVDNVKPHCFSNQLYKGIMDDNATGVFNGKIFVRPQAQKTNAYQSNKNILLSGSASVNTKPQLEIFADDVKCSHGCTIGRLDEEALFYLRSRGVSEKNAKSLLLHAFASDILENIKLKPIRDYVDQQVSQRLDFNES